MPSRRRPPAPGRGKQAQKPKAPKAKVPPKKGKTK